MMNYVNTQELRNIVRQALREDMGRGDITTQKTIPKDAKIEAVIMAKEKGIVCGIDIAKLVFRSLNSKVRFVSLLKDGDKVRKGMIIARISGLASSILSAERVALNFLGFLSGISTRTRQFLERIRPYKVKILDTRKTLPTLRRLEKYAVRTGGGFNHRQSLDEMVLIKDNHLRIIRGELRGKKDLKDIVSGIRKNLFGKIKIEAEVKNLEEFKQVLEAKPDIIMLDNLKVYQVRKAVQLKNNLTPKLEASGNINLKDIRAYAATGIDFISLGTLTKDVRSLDMSLEVKQCIINERRRR